MSIPAPPRPSRAGGLPAHRRIILGALAMMMITAVGVIGPTSAAAAAPLTRVSLTFDDSNADELTAEQTLDTNGLHGTFYTISSYINAPDHFTLANLNTIAADGNEIAGHTVTHPDLTTLSTDEATRQICNDRVNLTNWGFQVTDFAYPFAAATAATEAIAKGCGYNSARGLGDIKTQIGCGGCAFAETTPPADPYYTKAPDEVDSTWTLTDLQNVVTNAETHGGGWVQLTFHHICAGCNPLSITPDLFNQFVAWLAPRAVTNNTVVQTVQQVIGGPLQPAVAGPAVPPAAPGVNGAQNPSLETAGTTALPQCWMAGGYGANTPTFTTTTNPAAAHTGAKAEQLGVSGYSSGDAKLLPTLDLGACAPSVTTGHTYSLRAWYTSTAVTQFVVYYRTSLGSWAYWTSSPWFASAPAWTQAVWTTPAIPAGATGLSFGLNLFGNATLNTDDYSLYDTMGAPATAATRAPAGASAGRLAPIVPAPPGASVKVTTQSPLYAPPDNDEPVGPAAHKARADRHAPSPPRKIHLVPGPNLLKPGVPFVLEEGAMTG
ncbi:MAG: polysaccharide deacetylase family protein [Pseudonocardiales bacterium]|nr:polysaccharide deacetylase family protein [Pseudonocardiales bacterium]MBV9028954.1 polysaccharide deacetylase family protein [Pseudonocardiales bacterium]MBW0011463.1 polysaccharide deacetylase family protein [Pseudonocardiales bacterium]